MWKTINRTQLCTGLLIILLTVVYFHTTSLPQIGFRSKIPFNDTDVFSNRKNKLHPGSGILATRNFQKATKSLKTANRRKYLIYFCDKNRGCNGLGGRQHSITNAFIYAMQMDRRFGIVMSTPCDVRQFFIPNKYNWIIPESNLFGKPYKVIERGTVLSLNETTEVIYLRTSSKNYVNMYSQIQHKLPPYLKGGTTRSQIVKLIWEYLMKPSHYVINHLKTLALPENLTCAHVRIGRSKNLPNDAPRNNLTSVPKLWDFMEKFDNTIFVATDNIEVRDSARRRFTKRYFDSGGSSFSMIAASIRNNSKDLYRFDRTGIKPFKLS
ncbi:hypothetical protein LOTGIDRAFT_172866 [Lottia gigantea]|uniref:GT23 domain-containing protein n=1 Tax=Lottia gigantea TaxID=225164 RepID=V4B4Z9_LOTGI|nr:hypothetical protein LOTGIDRAFT_172866 [Lottia gigantea]ESP01032.1 hypothetical protein LOTGIDRAFT_172866 [Lottia gigantea]